VVVVLSHAIFSECQSHISCSNFNKSLVMHMHTTKYTEAAPSYKKCHIDICIKTKTGCSEMLNPVPYVVLNSFIRSFTGSSGLYFQAVAQPALHFGSGNFHEISVDDVIVLIQPWYNFFANRHRWSSPRSISEKENVSVLIKMQTERWGQSKNW